MAELNLFNLKGSDFLPGSDCAVVIPDRPYVELAHSLVYTSPLLQPGDIRINERQPVNTEGIFILTGIQILTPLVNTYASGSIAEPENWAFVFSAVAAGTAGNGIEILIKNNGPSLPLTVTVVGKLITVQMQTNAAGNGIGNLGALLAALQSNPQVTALLTGFQITNGSASSIITQNNNSGTTSGASTSQNILYVRFQWPNGRYTSNIRVDHTVCYAPFKDDLPSGTSNAGVQLPRPARIEPVLCLPGNDIGIEVENRASLAQSSFAAMVEFRGRLRRFLKT